MELKHLVIEIPETKIDNMEKKIDNVETKIDNMETEVDNVETEVDNMEKAVPEVIELGSDQSVQQESQQLKQSRQSKSKIHGRKLSETVEEAPKFPTISPQLDSTSQHKETQNFQQTTV
jgi:hypothetical protein